MVVRRIKIRSAAEVWNQRFSRIANLIPSYYSLVTSRQSLFSHMRQVHIQLFGLCI